MKFITQSGTVYEVDTENKRFRRVPQSDGYLRSDDGQWADYKSFGYVEVDKIEVGYPVQFHLDDTKCLITSKVAYIDESN